MATKRHQSRSDEAPRLARTGLAGWIGPALLLLSALAVKAVVLAQLHDHPLLQPEGGLDSEVYVRLARQAAAGDWFLGHEAYFVSPFYVYFLAVVFIFSGSSLLAAKIVQIVLGAAAVGLVFATAQTWYGRRVAWVAGALAAATGVFTFNEVLLLQSAVDPFLTALALYLLALVLVRERLAGFAAAGLALGVFVTNRPNALAWAAVLVVLLAVVPLSRKSLLRAAMLLAGLLVALGPVAVRNRVVSGEWILVSSHGGLNFYIGNNAEADGTYHHVPGIAADIEGQIRDARTVAETAAGRPLRASEVSRYFYRRAWDWIGLRPDAALRLFLRKLAYCFNAVDLSLNYSYAYYSREEATLLRVLLVGPWLLVPLGLLGLAAVPRRTGVPGFWIWAAFVPAYAVSVAAFFVSGRYRLPLLVPLCVGAGAAVVWLFDAARARRARPLLLATGALLLLGIGANWDWRLDDGRSEERTQMIVRLVDEGRFGEARAILEEARRAEPARSEIRQALARVHESEGVAASLAGRHAEGAAELERAVQLDPESASAHLNLAVAYAQLGRYTEARARAEEALRLRPDYPQAQRLLQELRQY
jgi:tetratricopeptide (TPR) repeat protein